MHIITVPHSTLRQQAKTVGAWNGEIDNLLSQLGSTLVNHRNPQGVGLAAPQVDVSLRIFATHLAVDENNESSPSQLRFFVNPVITRHSPKHTFGPQPRQPILEGCLSIPKLYGAVPRWDWVEFEFDTPPTGGGDWEHHKERFEGFAARVMQHEFDHLEGLLFTDYTLKYELPIYTENKKTKELEEIDPQVLLAF